ncbi:hypothetical protein [Bradyrhizobium sp. CCBAU 51753]|uniref:hypothetical protein n=1 Tax=Bradyrhizobium sp. CCBAU 51753 TaxID=1325100 RepID=UPI00188A3649|nr:hypothetical protein [Bradyrhizobium sp. CCBAU 51753]QOZ27808.1 hypothetical protein XH93_32480 [Bradyrhizobium sp. CCBAU 51753]
MSKVRRAIIREWMTLAREQRQFPAQASAFAKVAIARHTLPRRRRTAQDIVMGWCGRAPGGPDLAA